MDLIRGFFLGVGLCGMFFTLVWGATPAHKPFFDKHQAMLAQCEADLPRNQTCVLIAIAQPPGASDE